MWNKTALPFLCGIMILSRVSRVSAFVLPRIRPTASLGSSAAVSTTQNHGGVSSSPKTIIPSFMPKTRLFSATTEEGNNLTRAVLKRVKTIDAVDPTDGTPVVIKGWVRTIRKQKTLAFVQVNDGSTLKGIQCVVSFDDIDEETKKGTYDYRMDENGCCGKECDLYQCFLPLLTISCNTIYPFFYPSTPFYTTTPPQPIPINHTYTNI